MSEQTRGFFERRAMDGIRAASEALFPPNDLGAPDHAATDMVPRTMEWVDELPPKQRRLLILLFVFVELVAPWALLSGLSRLSRMSVDRRTHAIRSWRRSRFYPIRLIGDAVKASLTMIYASHDSVLRYVGMVDGTARRAELLEAAARTGALSGVM